MALEEYQAKRDFRRTSEPAGRPDPAHRRPIFVVQEHHASHLHYDFRLEADGVLKSWAIPKGPSLDPSQKRLAVQVEDHPLAYASFAGTIPAGQYGAGEVYRWDHGTYENLLANGDDPQTVSEGLAAGRLDFVLYGEKLQGRFVLLRMKGQRRHGKDNWLLIKADDEFARNEPTTNEPKRSSKPANRRRSSVSHAAPRIASNSPEAVAITHPDKVLFPEGITKAEVARFYRRIAPWLLPHLRDRPVTLERFPEGCGDDKSHFWQKDIPASYPDWLPRVELPSERGKAVHYPVINDIETLLYWVNQGTLTFHVWLSRIGDLDRPDFVLFDLDPGEAAFAQVVTIARRLHELLDEEDAEPLLKTSGKTGLHVLMPWTAAGGYDEARGWAEEIAGRLVEALPELATLERGKARRNGRVYVDVVQNARGHHAVPPYVLRPVAEAPVSTPLHWRELTLDLDPARYNLKTIFRRLARQRRDLMAALVQNGSEVTA